jgi:hypothetical protein
METATSDQLAPVVEWISKAQAEKELERTRRTIEKWIDAGYIRTKTARNAGGQETTLLHAGDVARIQHEGIPMAKPATATSALPAAMPAPAPMLLLAAPAEPAAAESAEKATATATSNPPPKRLLLHEAEKRSGIPASVLDEACETGKLRAIKAFGKLRGGWLISECELDAYHGELHGRCAS